MRQESVSRSARARIGESFVNDRPENVCFACSPHNSAGLRLEFTRTGERTIEARYTAPAHLCGMPGVIHGGIQATLLDEVMGNAAHLGFPDEDTSAVTVELQVRYRRPAPAGQTLVARGEIDRVEGSDIHLKGAILDANGTVLTEATSRWRRIS